MRYRKRVKIAPGVRLNLSKSGASMSFGVRGGSTTIGKDGVYANFGIPGTGIYDRKKILGSSNSKSTPADSFGGMTDSSQMPYPATMHIQVVYEEDGSVKFLSDGEIITDPQLISMIKNAPEYKAEIENMSKSRIKDYGDLSDKFTSIQSDAAKVYESIDALKAQIPCKKYVEKPFAGIPSDEELMKEAEKRVSTVKFWQKKKLMEEFVQSRKRDFNDLRAAHLIREHANARTANEKYQLEHEEKLAEVDALAKASESQIGEAFEDWLASVDMPFDFHIDYEIKDDVILVDLDLPEIEDLPQQKAVQMASGKVKIADKTQKDLKADYAECVFGLTIYVASHLFNLALRYDNITVSAYTQRRDRQGRMVDDYILSVKFDRIGFSKLSYSDSPEKNCMKFENACLLNADKGFKKIVPF